MSIDYERIYARGGWYGEDEIAQASVSHGPLAHWVGSLYQSYKIERALPAFVAANDPAAIEELQTSFSWFNQTYKIGPACELYCLENALLLDRTLYVPLNNQWTALYETQRPFERELKTLPAPTGDIESAKSPPSDRDYLYFGSVASENYGHWMIDDVARARAISAFGADRPACVLLDQYHPVIDQIRLATLSRILGRKRAVTIEFIDKKVPHFFRQLYYVTPHSYQAILKSPDALAYTRNVLRVDDAQAPERLFVDRNALWRNLLDARIVADRLAALGFTCVRTDNLSIEQQAALFSRARIVVGVVGASLVNTLFTPRDARVIYLAPKGFLDPFYWDLAASNGHEFRVIYGTPNHPHRPTFSSFTLGEEMLQILCGWAL